MIYLFFVFIDINNSTMTRLFSIQRQQKDHNKLTKHALGNKKEKKNREKLITIKQIKIERRGELNAKNIS